LVTGSRREPGRDGHLDASRSQFRQCTLGPRKRTYLAVQDSGGIRSLERRVRGWSARLVLRHFGPFAAVLALAVHSIGTLGKLFAETIEEMDMGPIDALRASGASRTQVFVRAVIPTVATAFVGLTLYRFDVNARDSLVTGIVGGGGIGFLHLQLDGALPISRSVDGAHRAAGLAARRRAHLDATPVSHQLRGRPADVALAPA
jgi:hypothetical protein